MTSAALGLAGCGFHPLYMTTESGAPGIAARELRAIDVGIIPDRQGQELREALQARLEGSTGASAYLYDLSVDYGIPGQGVGTRPDNFTTRVRLIATARWTLRSRDPSRSVVTSGTARAVDGYNVVDQQFFAGDLENTATQRRLAEAVADRIVAEIATFFRRRTLAAAP